MIKKHILIVDDDDRIRSLLAQYLKKNGFIVSTSKDTLEARRALEKLDLDLIILDIMLPGENGKDFARYLRRISPISIIMLTALGETSDRVEGLESGADDYLPKPFEPKELLLRIDNILKRSSYKLYPKEEVSYFGDIAFNAKKNIVTKDNSQIKLSDGESRLLSFLLSKINKVVSREEISRHLHNINSRSVDVQITRLRNKIEAEPKNPVYLQSIRNKGYILHAD
ncbi:MAG: response regulator transcription factor [Rickettsiales bacterium]